MRCCKISVGCKLPTHPCCADCGDKTCEARCWNSPSRCGCWEDSSTPYLKAVRPGRPTKIDAQEVVSMYQKGLFQWMIAQRMGCSPATVSRILRKLGVTRNGQL